MSETNPVTEYEEEIRALYRERNERTFGKPEKNRHTLRRLIDFAALLVLIGVASVTASLKVYDWLMPLGAMPPGERASRLTAAQPELTNDYITQLAGSAATIFSARATKAEATLAEQSYLLGEALGQAVVLSSDGWLVTTQAVVADVTKDYVAMPADGRVYKVTAVALDPVAPLAYLKIEARNLTATPFAAPEKLTLNQSVVVITGESQGVGRSWYLRYLAGLFARAPVAARADLPTSSEVMPDRYILSESLPAGSKGAPVLNLQGEIVGLAADYGGQLRGVVPLTNLQSVMATLFSEQKAVRPFLGATYIQSTWLITSATLKPGAILSGSAKRAAVVPKSPAAAAGLKDGDNIIAIAEQALGTQSLSLALQRYRPGSTVEFTIERAGRVQQIKVTLGELQGETSHGK